MLPFEFSGYCVVTCCIVSHSFLSMHMIGKPFEKCHGSPLPLFVLTASPGLGYAVLYCTVLYSALTHHRVYSGTQKDTFNDEEERFESMKKQKVVAERKEFEAVKASMTYSKEKMDNMRRQVHTVCRTILYCAVLYYAVLSTRSE